MKRLVAAVFLCGAIALMTGCSSPGTSAPTTAQSGEVQVVIKNMQYAPNNLVIKAGTRVTFVNQDTLTHDVTQSTPADVNKVKPSFTSGPIAPGSSWSMVFDKPGTYPILCTQGAHYTAGMVATIKVTP
ncbi:MAG: plastocyanin/azurin family copper-binding protein [Mycobacterium leprae]